MVRIHRPSLEWRLAARVLVLTAAVSRVAILLVARLLRDLGNARVDARLLTAILLRDGRVAAWLRARQIGVDEVERFFPGSRW